MTGRYTGGRVEVLRRWGGRAALVVLGLAAGLAVMELVLRTLPDRRPATGLAALHVVRPDRPWLYGLRPGAQASERGDVTYVVNADGFRDEVYRRPKPTGTFRVVVLGDSVAFGYAVAARDGFVKVMEAQLRAAAPGVPIEVLNLGVSGYNPYTEAALFADVGTTYEPDLVVVEFCINDLNDPTLHFEHSTIARLDFMPDAAFPDPRTRRPTSHAAALCERLRVCRLVTDAFAASASHAGPGAPDPALVRALLPDDKPSPGVLRWLRTRYGEIVATASAHGARVAVVVFPFEAQLQGTMSPDRVARRIAKLGRLAGWSTLDLFPTFRDARLAPDRLFVDLYHPTAVGHRLAGEAIARWLACSRLVPVPCPDGAPAH